MKNLKYFLVLAALIFAGLIGYYIGDKKSTSSTINSTNFVEDLEKEENRMALSEYFSPNINSPHPAKAITLDSTKKLVKLLYDTLATDKSFINSTISPSYVFNLSDIIGVAVANYQKPEDIQMRIYPAVNDSGSDGKKLSFIIAIESNNQVLMGDYQQFEYIAPCPWNCPPDGKDYFTRQEWIDLYGRAFNTRSKLDFTKN